MIRAYDVDGVFADFNTKFRTTVFDQTGVTMPPISDTFPTSWHYHTAAGVTKAQGSQLWKFIKDGNNNYFTDLSPLPGCHDTLQLIAEQREAGDHVYFMTSRCGPYAKLQTEFWLTMMGYELPTVLIAQNKGPLCKALEVGFFVDDKPENCVDAKDWGVKKVFLVDKPYNRDFAYQGVIRVASAMNAISKEVLSV